MKLRLASWVLLPIAGALALYVLAWPTRPRLDDVRLIWVTAKDIRDAQPPVDQGIGDRIQFKVVGPEKVAIAPRGAAEQVASFCRPVILATTDTVEVPVDPQLAIETVDTDPGWFFHPDRILLTGFTNTGDLKALEFRGRNGWDARTDGDSVIFRTPRFGLAREGAQAGILVGFGVLLGHLLWR